MEAMSLNEFLASLEGRKLSYQISQLRRAYYHLIKGRVTDHKAFAEGFIAPAIEYLESIHTAGENLWARSEQMTYGANRAPDRYPTGRRPERAPGAKRVEPDTGAQTKRPS